MAGGSNINSFLDLTAELVSAYVSNNPVPTNELAALIGQVHQTLSGLSAGTMSAVPTPQTPAVPVKKSVTADFIICLEDGKKFKSLKRHLGVHFNMTPDEYRAKWNLPADYPMVAPNYAATRSALAKKIGLGGKSAEPVKRKGKKAA